MYIKIACMEILYSDSLLCRNAFYLVPIMTVNCCVRHIQILFWKHRRYKICVCRAEKTEVLTEDLVTTEKRVKLLEQTCTSTSKRFSQLLCHHGSNEKDPDKRLVHYFYFILSLSSF